MSEVLAIVGLLLGAGGIGALLKTRAEVRSMARADDLEALRAVVAEQAGLIGILKKRIETQQGRIDELERENLRLCAILRINGIDPNDSMIIMPARERERKI